MNTQKRWSLLTNRTVRSAVLGASVILSGASLASAKDVPILVYGKIGPTAENQFWVSTQSFRSQLEALKDRGYTTVSLSDVVAHRNNGTALPEKPIVITFTNGYQNVINIVDPIFQELGFRGTVMLLPSYMHATQNRPSDWDVPEAGSPIPHLSWANVNTLLASGRWDIGSHSATHRRLTEATPAQLQQEIAGSRDAIIANSNATQVRWFSYPFGAHNATIRQAVQNAGYQAALGVRNDVSHTDLFRLPRLDVDSAVTATPNAARPDKYLFGPQWLNDSGAGTGGDFHPADTNQDWTIAISELTAFGAKWRQGNANIGELTRAGFLWRQGGRYTHDANGSGANRWVPANN
jgi:peptidoglycan/xylan/chitin deacetylase (PgdA/CDA1 family)